MKAWALEIESMTPQLAAILLGDPSEVDGITQRRILFGYGREPLILVGILPFSFCSDSAVVWCCPTKFTEARAFSVRRECIRLARAYLAQFRWRFFAELEPGNRASFSLARAIGFAPRALMHDRLVVELPKCS
jgi:hypothetical protein